MRFPLAFVFLQNDPFYRALAILLAMATDGLDGYIARRFHQKSRLGTLLDPLADKFFVFFALGVLVHEAKLNWNECALFICRDFSVVLYGLYLAYRGRLATYQFRAIWCGKIATVLQLSLLFVLSLGYLIPEIFFTLFAFLGGAALIELYFTDRKRRRIRNLGPTN